jgi:hypothetical protein
MLNPQELRQLTRWCAARHLHWQPARSEEGAPAILLRPDIRRAAWHGMLLVESDDGVMLFDEAGDILANASEIPALLDALDSGLITGPKAPIPGRFPRRPETCSALE